MQQLSGLLKLRFWTSVVQPVLFVILVCSICYGTHKRRSRTAQSCPVRLRSNSTVATCDCSTSTINEIRCSGGLDAVPEFLTSDRVFHTLHISKQNISEVIQGSFTNLQVSFRLLLPNWYNHINQCATAYSMYAQRTICYRQSVRLHVCPTCPSHGWISRKRLKLGL